MKWPSFIFRNRDAEWPQPNRIAWLGAVTLLLSSWMANAGVAAPSASLNSTALDQQLLARAAEASAADVESLIRRGAHVNAQDRFGVTPMMQAVIGNNAAVVRALLAAGANVDARNLRGDTALDLARQLGRREIERLLLKPRKGVLGPNSLRRHHK